jgi:hypothetical protein
MKATISVIWVSYIIFLFSTLSGFSQNAFQGTVVDQKTRKPVPYAGIKLKSNKFQTMANADGCYAIPNEFFLKNDTIIISCIGYNSKVILLKKVEIAPITVLDPVIYQLNSVEITATGKPDYPYQLMDELFRKYRKYKINQQSKGYFWFLSRTGEMPLELVEQHFNCDFSCSKGVQKLTLKNGRLGHCRNMFYSLNTSEILTNFSLFSLSGNQNIPCSPGNFTYRQLKKLYEIEIIKYSTENGTKKLVMQFRAKKDNLTLFSGVVWIDKDQKLLEKIEYQIKLHDFHYLRPAVPGDRTDSIDLHLQYTFDNSEAKKPRILFTSLNYSLLYFSKKQSDTIRVTSEGNLFLYDIANPFPGTIPPEFVENQLNDYQKICCLPYDSLFWAHSTITPQSAEQNLFTDYFRAKGVLLNYSKALDSLSGSDYIRWDVSSTVPFSGLFNKAPKVQVAPYGTTSFNMKNPVFYNIECLILLNPVIISDSLHLNSITLLDNANTYYFLGHDTKATAFVNLTFDMYENQRREIIAGCNAVSKSHKITLNEVQSIYNDKLDQLKETLKLFRDETKNGTNTDALVKWSEKTYLKTGIDRSTLIKQVLTDDINSIKNN